jgi:hypothetical protein
MLVVITGTGLLYRLAVSVGLLGHSRASGEGESNQGDEEMSHSLVLRYFRGGAGNISVVAVW